MCVAIYKPEGVQLSKKVLKKCFKENSDGAGFAYLDENKHAVIKKGFFTFPDFWRAYREYMPLECIVHFRWATHGAENAENCHPFALPGNGALIHNGVIDFAAPRNVLDERSDTRAFVEDIITNLMAQGLDLHSEAFQIVLSEAIGQMNKLVMFHEGKHIIINPQSGGWKYGAWFSNFAWERQYESYATGGLVQVTTRVGDRVDTQTYQGGAAFTYANYAYGDRVQRHKEYALGYGEDSRDLEPWEAEEDEESIQVTKSERVDLKHIYARCEICNEWKPETGMLSIGAEKACPACWDHINSWDDVSEDEAIAERIERYAG